MKKLVIEYVPFSEIEKAEYNPRQIEAESFNGLKNSLTEFDLLQPLIVNQRKGKLILVSGHQRLDAMVELGKTNIPIIKVKLNEKKEKLLNLTLNNAKIQGYFTNDMETILKELHFDDEKLLSELNFNYKPEENFESLKFISADVPPDLGKIAVVKTQLAEEWESDIKKMDKVKENTDAIPSKIIITCQPLDKDAVLFYLKEKLMETAFEGVHIE